MSSFRASPFGWALLCVCFILGAGCQSRPIQELALADVALKAAQKAKADALSTDVYRRAENYYLRAMKDFRDGYFDSSRRFAREARLTAEKAEYEALYKQTQLKQSSSSYGREF